MSGISERIVAVLPGLENPHPPPKLRILLALMAAKVLDIPHLGVRGRIVLR